MIILLATLAQAFAAGSLPEVHKHSLPASKVTVYENKVYELAVATDFKIHFNLVTQLQSTPTPTCQPQQFDIIFHSETTLDIPNDQAILNQESHQLLLWNSTALTLLTFEFPRQASYYVGMRDSYVHLNMTRRILPLQDVLLWANFNETHAVALRPNLTILALCLNTLEVATFGTDLFQEQVYSLLGANNTLIAFTHKGLYQLRLEAGKFVRYNFLEHLGLRQARIKFNRRDVIVEQTDHLVSVYSYSGEKLQLRSQMQRRSHTHSRHQADVLLNGSVQYSFSQEVLPENWDQIQYLANYLVHISNAGVHKLNFQFQSGLSKPSYFLFPELRQLFLFEHFYFKDTIVAVSDKKVMLLPLEYKEPHLLCHVGETFQEGEIDFQATAQHCFDASKNYDECILEGKFKRKNRVYASGVAQGLRQRGDGGRAHNFDPGRGFWSDWDYSVYCEAILLGVVEHESSRGVAGNGASGVCNGKVGRLHRASEYLGTNWQPRLKYNFMNQKIKQQLFQQFGSALGFEQKQEYLAALAKSSKDSLPIIKDWQHQLLEHQLATLRKQLAISKITEEQQLHQGVLDLNDPREIAKVKAFLFEGQTYKDECKSSIPINDPSSAKHPGKTKGRKKKKANPKEEEAKPKEDEPNQERPKEKEPPKKAKPSKPKTKAAKKKSAPGKSAKHPIQPPTKGNNKPKLNKKAEGEPLPKTKKKIGKLKKTTKDKGKSAQSTKARK